jgi:hypothetical protein
MLDQGVFTRDLIPIRRIFKPVLLNWIIKKKMEDLMIGIVAALRQNLKIVREQRDGYLRGGGGGGRGGEREKR